jgi:hypothetical protein
MGTFGSSNTGLNDKEEQAGIPGKNSVSFRFKHPVISV